MKQFILFALTLLLVNFISNADAQVPSEDESGSSLKYEGTCSGSLADGTAISFNYYSDFDGCKDISKSAVTFTSGIEGLLTGYRTFTDSQDRYTFPRQVLTFADSTGNTSAVMKLRNVQDEEETVQLQCDVRDYEYVDC